MVDSFCARAATDDSPLEDELKSGGGFWGTEGLFASVVVVCPADAKSFGSDGRGFFGGNGFDLLLAVLAWIKSSWRCVRAQIFNSLRLSCVTCFTKRWWSCFNF